MLFLGLGTGLGSAMIVDGIVEPMELAHLPYKKGTFEDYVGAARLWTAWQKEMAAACRGRGGPPDRRPGTRRRGSRRRQRQETERAASGVPRRRQRQRVLGGFRLWEKPLIGDLSTRKGSLLTKGTLMTARTECTNARPQPLTERPAWKALEAHYKKIRERASARTLRR